MSEVFKLLFCLSKMLECFFRSCVFCLSEGCIVYVLEDFFRSCVFCQRVSVLEVFFMYSLFVRGFSIKRFLWVLLFCFCFCRFTVCVSGFFRFSMFVKVWGVRRLFQVYCFGVSEVSRFKCQRISSDLGLQFQDWVANGFKVYLTEDFGRASV